MATFVKIEGKALKVEQARRPAKTVFDHLSEEKKWSDLRMPVSVF